MKKKIIKKQIKPEIKPEVKSEIKKEVKLEFKQITPQVIIELQKLIDNVSVIPCDNLIYEVPPVNKQQKKEAEQL